MSSLAAMTWPQAEHVRQCVLAVPVGATEQHGPHLPLTTDSDIALALTAGLSREREDVVVAPLVAYGASGEHADFPGTFSIGRDAVQHLLVELGRSASLSVDRVLLVSTHGGNAEPVRRAVELLRAEGRDVRSWSPGWSGDAHAGRTETSLMLAIAPERVDVARAVAGAVEPLQDLLPALRAGGVRAVSPSGILGDPAGANPAEGRELLAQGLRELCVLVDGWPVARQAGVA